jgi:hypothetical protein
MAAHSRPITIKKKLKLCAPLAGRHPPTLSQSVVLDAALSS